MKNIEWIFNGIGTKLLIGIVPKVNFGVHNIE